MKRHLNYLKYVLRHKWFVIVASRKIGASMWLALIHDMSKFLPSEWFPYARTFYAKDGSKQYVETAEFNRAWLLHQHRNPHHWQHWLLRMDNPTARYALQDNGDVEGGTHIYDFQTGTETKVPECDLMANRSDIDKSVRTMLRHANMNAGMVVIEIPEKYLLEMLADWMGAGRAIKGFWDIEQWYKQNKFKIVLHPKTRGLVEMFMLGAKEQT